MMSTREHTLSIAALLLCAALLLSLLLGDTLAHWQDYAP